MLITVGQGGLGDVILHPDFANNEFDLPQLRRVRRGQGDVVLTVARGQAGHG